MKERVLLFACFCIFVLFTCHAQSKADYSAADFIISKDGSGDFTTVQEAIYAVPDFRSKRTIIYIKNGIYKEKLLLPLTKINITFIGQNVDSTIITYDDYASVKNRFGENIGTSGSSGFYINGDGFTAENITFSNTAGPVGQAVAVRIMGDMVMFRNCKFLGCQDTLYPRGEKSRQYFKNCYIEGTVDFIFGWSTAVFDSCDIFCKRRGYITAASTLEETKYGFVFLNCNITGDAPDSSFYLGRPWRPYSNVVYIKCRMSSIIKPEGWHNWDKEENEKTARYAEYKCYGPGFQPDKRVKWSHQLTDEEAKEYTLEKIFGDWNPKGE
ncbi:MAG: hypothetical protein JXB49_31620 [Bacteroidales bacterium]|nr:hypothetical protein [Bacteroidales bacterium]